MFCILCRARRKGEQCQNPNTKVAQSCTYLHACHAASDARYFLQILCVIMQIMKFIMSSLEVSAVVSNTRYQSRPNSQWTIMSECGSCLQMKGHKGGRASQKKTNTGAHLNARTPQCAPEESSERAGGADLIMKISNYESISSTYLTLRINSPQPLSPCINL